jgi:hypothetical protein
MRQHMQKQLAVTVCRWINLAGDPSALRHKYPCVLLCSPAPTLLSCSYPVVVGSVLGLFSCKQLESAAQVPGEVNMAQGSYWNRVSGQGP